MKRCNFTNCKNKLSFSLYDTLFCKYCSKHFCFIHRLPEDHICSNLQLIKIKHKKESNDKLLAEAIKNSTLKIF
jgi:predicted nucleic acid binding AN1-type Zn finger protein